jgi:2-methylcitrate dehydratase PrpD
MSPDVGRSLAEFTCTLEFSDLGKEEVAFLKQLMLKTVAGILAGTTTPSGRRMLRFIRERRDVPDISVMGCGFKTSLWNAVVAEGFFAHASELEDDRLREGVSWDITTFPLTFPLAEKCRLSGKEMLVACAVGLEVDTRTCMHSARHRGLLIFPGTIGPAAAAAKALKLNVGQTLSAFGLSMSGGAPTHLSSGTDAHFFESTAQGLRGLMAAELAQAGFTGNAALSEYLFDLLGKDRVDPSKMTDGLKDRWFFREITIKKYPCCFINHRYIDALLGLARENNLTYDQVDAIEVNLSPTQNVVNRPEPNSPGELQFSIQHNIASAILDRDVNLNHFTTEKITAPLFREARSRVRVVMNGDCQKQADLIESVRLDVRLKDGRTLTGERAQVIGSPEEPLTLEQVKQLYRKYVRGILSEAQMEWTIETILNMENLSDLDPLIDVLTFGHAAKNRLTPGAKSRAKVAVAKKFRMSGKRIGGQ